MHPDQFTADSHRHQAPDSAETEAAAKTSSETVSTPETDGARVAEAGHGYVGRTMDDDIKTNPRLQDGDEAVDGDPTTPGDE